MKYDRGSINDTMEKARRVVDMAQEKRYVYATAYGFVITPLAPPPGQPHYTVFPGNVVASYRVPETIA